MRTVSLRPGEDSIRLGQLLKLVDAVPTGAQVKDVLFAGDVRVNGEPEERRGRQLHRGDVVSLEGMEDVLFAGDVRVNGEPEERRGRQLHRGDVVSLEGMEDVRIG